LSILGALRVVLNKQLGLSFGDVATLFQQQYGLRITTSGLVHAVHRAGRHALPTYEALCNTIRESPVVTPDETGWKVAGTLQWLWTVATPDTTVYAIQPGRGFDEAAALLGADYDGVIVRDGWAPYRKFTQAIPQSCLAHLLRRSRVLLTDHPRTTFPADVRATLQQALAVRDRYLAGDVSDHGLAVARGHLEARLNRRLDRPGTVPDVQRFAAHLAVEFPALFTFLLDPTTIDATNWRAEQALRPAVVTRTVWASHRTAPARSHMKRNVVLTITSLLSILLLTLHVTDDIVRGISKAEPSNIAILVLAVFLYGTLVLAEQRSGHVIMLFVGLFAAGMPVIHMRGAHYPEIAKSAGGFFFVWTLWALGGLGVFTFVLSAQGLWAMRRGQPR